MMREKQRGRGTPPPPRRGSLAATTDAAGFTIVEAMGGIAVLVLGALGMLGAVISGFALGRSAREVDVATIALSGALEDVRSACAADFDAALAALIATPQVPPASLPEGLGSSVVLTRLAVLDETQISPPLDLNGDGDVLDGGLAPADVAAFVLSAEIVWQGGAGRRRLELTTLVSRGVPR
jgi:hypothetical protein